jgi:hypothetical protein
MTVTMTPGTSRHRWRACPETGGTRPSWPSTYSSQTAAGVEHEYHQVCEVRRPTSRTETAPSRSAAGTRDAVGVR